MAIILDDGPGTPTPGQGGGGGGDAVKDTTAATFMADVIEQSQTMPVIVDFWAEWCGPCKSLGPMLEKLVRQSGGKVKMVKVDVDKDQQLAAQFRIQSIPTVYAFKDGRPVDGFQGALPESQLKQFIERLAGGGNVVDEALEQAREFLDTNQPDQAAALYEQVLNDDPANPFAIAGIMRCYMAMNEPDAARELLGQLPADVLAHSEVQAVKTALELADEAGGAASDEIAELEARVQTDPNDLQARFDLANALYAANQREAAVDQLLEIFRRDRTWNEEAARTQLVKFFEAFGPKDPATIKGRKKLSTLMFA